MKFTPYLLLLSLLVGQIHAQDAAAASKDEAILSVDGTPILKSEVADYIERAYGQRLAQYPPEQATAMISQIQTTVINELIGKILLVNAAKREGIEVNDEDMTAMMQDVVNQNLPGGTVDEFVEQAGISKERFVKDVRENILITRLADLKTVDVPMPTAQEISAFYEEKKAEMVQPESVRARHILIKTEGITDPAVLDAKRTEAEAIRQALLKDPESDFAKMAAEKSEGPSGPNGGDLGQFGRGQMVPPFEEAAFSQGVGEIGELVETRFGFHIIKVEERNEGKAFTLEEITPQITQHLSQQKKADHLKNLVDELRAVAEIVQPGAEKPAKS